MGHVMRVAVPEQPIHKDRQQRENRNQFDEEINQVGHSIVPFRGCSANQPCCREPEPKAYSWGYVEGYEPPTALLDVIVHILLPL
jgi:hypothetical protein